MQPFCAQIYCTTRCGNKCSHCLVRSSKPGDADFDNIERNLKELAHLGVPYADFTGGDPLLCDWLPEALMLSNTLGHYSSLTVSGPMVSKLGAKFIGLPSILRFSIDGEKDYHNQNRGQGFYDHVLEGLSIAKELRKNKSTQLIFTAIPGQNGNINPHTLESVLSLARDYGLLVNVNPVFNSGLSQEEKNNLIWFAKQADVQLSRGRLRFMAKGGNNIKNPTCRAVGSVITISSDNYLVLPCYHHPVGKISLDQGISNAIRSAQRKKIAENQGRYQFCHECSIWCYIIPSWITLAPFRLVAWLHSLSGLQIARDNLLRTAGRLHPKHPYPHFSPKG